VTSTRSTTLIIAASSLLNASSARLAGKSGDLPSWMLAWRWVCSTRPVA
jgi:hypothetical protein